MYAPGRDDEITTLIGYLDEQLAAIRAAPYGLTEEQVRCRPCRSALSVGGIVKYLAYGMVGWIDQFRASSPAERPLDYAAHAASFALTEDETMTSVLADFDARRAELMTVLRGVDPGGASEAPPAPWYGVEEVRPIFNRFQLMHFVAEAARHAGHADLLREELDGVSVPALVMTRDGLPANDFFTPYRPAPGTITD